MLILCTRKKDIVKSILILLFILNTIFVSNAQITQPTAWTKAYDQVSGTGNTASFAIATGSNRMLVVFVSHTFSGSAAQLDPTTISYGGVTLTKATDNGITSGRMHTWIYYLKDNAVMDNTSRPLNVTLGGTHLNMTVWYGVFAGVDLTPGSYTTGNGFNNTSGSGPAQLSAAMTVNADAQAIYYSSVYSNNLTLPVYTINANWTSGGINTGNNGTVSWKNEPAKRAIPGANTTDNAATSTITPAAGVRWAMSAMSLPAPMRYAVASGNWNGAIWATTSGGVAGSAAVPTSADIVTINATRTVTVNISNAACASLRLNHGVAGTATLTFNSGSQVTVSGTTTIGNATNNGSGVLNMTNGGTLITNALATAGTGTRTFTSGTGTVVLATTNTIPNQTAFSTFYNLTIDNTTTLGRSVTVSGSLIQNANIALGLNALVVNGSHDAKTFTVSGTGAYTLGNGASYLTAHTSGINGNITTSGTKTFNTNNNFTFNASSAQVTGTLFPITINNTTINNSAGLTYSNTTTDLTVAGIVTLTSGIFDVVTNGRTLRLSNNSASAITGGSSTNFIQGALRWTMATTGVTYVFPVGKGGNYYPFTLISPTGTTPVMTVQAYNTNSGGTFTSPIISISTTEYWALTWVSGTFSGATVSLERPDAIGQMNVIGNNATGANGNYVSINGTISGNSIINSDNIGAIAAGSEYFVFASAPPQRYAVATGNWDAAIWAATSGGAAGSASVPTSSDAVTIKSGVNVTVNINTAACLSLQVNHGVAAAATLTFANASQLTVSYTATLGNATNNGAGIIDMTNGGTLICGTLATAGTGTRTFTRGTGTVVLSSVNTLPASSFTTFNNLTINGATTLGVSMAVDGTLTQNANIAVSTFTLTVNGIHDANSSIVSGGGGYTLASGASFICAHANGLNGNITTTTRTWNTNNNFTYDGTSAQTTGSYLPNTINNLTINNSSGITFNKTANLTVAGTVTLTNGVLDFAATGFLLIVTNTSVSAITGGSISNFVMGPIRWTLATTGNTYIYPVGKGGTYYPFTLTNPTGTTPVVEVEAFNSDPAGTFTSPITAISNTEYWDAALISGTFTGGTVSLDRQIPLGTSTVIGRNTTAANGNYVSITGTISGNAIINSDNLGSNLGWFCIATTPPPRYAVVNGNWDGAIWATTPGGAAGSASVPTNADVTYINAGVTVTVNTDVAECYKLYINEGTVGTAILIFNNGSQLTVSGALTLGNATNNGSGTFDMSAGGVLICNSLATAGSGTRSFIAGTGAITLAAVNTLPANSFVAFNILNINAVTTLGANITINGTLVQAANIAVGSNTLTIVGTHDAATFTVSGVGGYTLNSGASFICASPTGINGNITTTTKTFDTNNNFTFDAGAAQVTGTLMPANINNLTVFNAYGLSLSQSTTIGAGGILNLTSGILTTNANVLSIYNTSSDAIIGGSATSFINGNLEWWLATSGLSYLYPVGKGGSYYPLSITNPTGANPLIKVVAFNAGSGGTATSPLSNISTTEYWNVSLTSGIFSGASVSIERPSSLGAFNVIARSATQGGAYANLNGLPTEFAVSISDNVGATLGYFTFAYPAPRYAVASGNWSGAIWANTSGGAAGSAPVPTVYDAVTINASVTVMVDISDAAAKTLQLNHGIAGNATLAFNNATQLTVSGAATIGNTTNNGSGVIDMTNGGTLVCSDIATAGTGTRTFTPGAGTLSLSGVNSIPNLATFNTFNNLTVSGTTTIQQNTSVTGILTQNANIEIGSNILTASGTHDVGTSTVSGAGTYTLGSGATFITASATGVDGNITATTKNFNTNNNFIFNGSVAQATGTLMPVNINNLTINNSAGVTLSQATTIANTGVLTLTSGNLNTTVANILAVANTDVASVTDGSATSYVSGPLRWSLATVVQSYLFPVGKGGNYYPFTLSSPTGTSPVVTVESFNSGSGGTGVAPITGISSTEYWSATFTGTYTGGEISLGRTISLGTLNVIGRSATQTGAYANLNGTINGNSIINSDNTGASLGYFCLAYPAPRYAVVSGNWNAAIWATTSNGVAGSAAVPVDGDAVTINSGVNVSVNISNAACFTLQLNDGFIGTAAGILTFNNGSQLTASGQVTLGNATNNGNGTITMTNGGILICNNLSTAGTGTRDFTYGTGTVVLTGTNSVPNLATFATFYNLTTNGTTTLQQNTAINNILIQNANIAVGINTLTINGTHDAGSFTVSGTNGRYTLATGASLITAHANGVNGNITTTNRTINTNTNYTFDGTSAQATGTFMAATINNLTVNNTAGVTLSQTTTIGVSGILTLTNGLLSTTSTNKPSILNTASSAVTGGATTNYISGPVTWSLATSGITYVYPVGKGGNYYPFTLTSPTGTSPVVTVEAFATGAGGSVNAPLTAISSTEYWLATFTGTYTGGTVSLGRPTIDAFNSIGRSTTQGGVYSTLNGTISGNSIINSDNTGNTLNYFALGSAPSARYAVATGNWSGAIWASTVGGAAGSASTPAITDAVIIKQGVNVSVDINNASSYSLQLNEGVAGNATLTFNANSKLTVWQTATVGNATNNGSGIIDMTNGGHLACNVLAMAGTGTRTLTSGIGTIELNAANTLPNTANMATFYNLTVDALTTFSRAITVNGTLLQNANINQSTFGLTVNGIHDAVTFTTGAGTGTYTLGNGASFITAHASGVNGNLTSTGTRTFGTNLNFTFNGTAAQATGTLLPTSIANLTINNAAGVTYSNTTTDLTVSGIVTLTAGIFNVATNNRYLIVTNSSTTAITSASPTAFVQDRVRWSVATTSNSYLFPIGAGGNYLPFTLSNPGCTGLSLNVRAYNTNPAGTFTAPLTAISNSEYWAVSINAGTIASGSVSLGRPAIGSMNAIGRNTTAATGNYLNLNGTIYGNSIINSDDIGANPGWFVLGTATVTPTTLTLSNPTTPVAAAEVCASSTIVPIHAFNISANGTSGSGTITNFVFTTTGTYAATDILNFKIWYNTTNSLGSATLLSTNNSPAVAGSQSFPAFSRAISGGTTNYFWITMDIESGAVEGRTIAVSASSGTAMITGLTQAGSCNASGTQTLHVIQTIALGSNPAVNIGTTTADLTYSATTGSPDKYSINYDATAEAQGFVDVTDAALPVSPIVLTVPVAPATGTYNYTVTVKNSTSGCSSISYAKTIQINGTPTITLGTDPVVCKEITSANLTYSATTNSPNQYSINYDATAEAQGFADVVNAVLPASPIALTVPVGAASGTYNYILTVRNSGSGFVSADYNKAVTINSVPTITLGTNPSVCQGTVSANLTYSATTNSPDVYSINFDATAEAQGFADVTNAVLPASPIVLTIPAGAVAGTYNYTVTVKINATGCASTAYAKTVAVNGIPSITLGSDPSVCIGTTSANLSYSATTFSPDKYSITYDVGAIAVGFVNVVNAALGVSPVVLTVPVAPATGNYYYTITVNNSSTGCISSDYSKGISVVANPTVANAGTNQTVNVSTATLAGNTAIIGTGTWTLISGTATITDPSSPTSGLTGLGSGANVLRWTISNPPCTDSYSDVTITYTLLPTITLGANPIVCMGTTSANLTYSATLNSPDQYSVDYDAAAEAQGFADVVNAALPASPIVLVVPGGATTSTYNAVLTVRNSGTGGVSQNYNITVTINANPTIANAGSNQNINTTTTTMAGNTPVTGTGTWTRISGTGNITSPNSASTGITDLSDGASVYRWTITNSPCTPSTSDVTINVTLPPTITLGSSPSVCQGVTSASLSYSAVTGSPDKYSINYDATAEAQGFVDVVNAVLPVSLISLIIPGAANAGTYNAILTVTNTTAGLTSSNNAFTIALVTPPTVAAAGPDQNVSLTSATLAGNTPTVGTGLWTIISGTATITTPTSPTSTVTGLITGTYVLRWTISNGTCTSSFDEMTINATIVAPTITLGANPTVCRGTTSASLTYNSTSNSPDQYSIDYDATANTRGFIDVVNAALPASPINLVVPGAVIAGSYNGSLAVKNSGTGGISNAYPIIVTVVNQPTTSNAGTSSSICITGTKTLNANNPAVGTGEWSIDSGPSILLSQFSNTALRTAVFTPAGGAGAYVLRWTISNSVCTPSSSTVTVTVNNPPTTANAGPDQTVYCVTTATLAGNTPTSGVGTWTVVSVGATVTTPTSPTSGVTGLANGTNMFRWTVVSSGCSNSFDNIYITKATVPATPGAITGTSTPYATFAGYTYSVPTVTYATTYNWTVPTGWTITSGSGTRSIIVTTGAVGQNGNISVTTSNPCGTSAASTKAVTPVIFPPHGDCLQCHPNLAHNGIIGPSNENANLCISCHNPTGSALSKPFANSMKAIPGTSGTSHQWDIAAVNATYQTNTPTNAQLAAKLDAGKIICSTCHNQHNPNSGNFLRISNTGDALCKDCHSARNVGTYASNPTNKGSHPVGVTYNGSDPEFNATPTNPKILTPGSKVECSSCHGIHDNQAITIPLTNDGYLLRATNNNTLCMSCHVNQTASFTFEHKGMTCSTCHEPHLGNGVFNIYIVRNSIQTPNSGLKTVSFTSNAAAANYADGSGTFDGVCEVCHTLTDHYSNTTGGTSDARHFPAPQKCINCHPHNQGFYAVANCFDCHNAVQDKPSIPGTTRQIVDNTGNGLGTGGDFKRTSHHVTGAIPNVNDCVKCHYMGDHKKGDVKLLDPDLGYANIITYNPADATSLETFCVKCHDANGSNGDMTPFSDNVTVPVVDQTLWNASAHKGSASVGTCFTCHNNGHGSNKSNLIAPYDYAGAGTGTDLMNEEEGFCLTCHGGTGVASVKVHLAFSSYTNTATNFYKHDPNSSYRKHKYNETTGASFTGTNRHIECVDCHNPHATKAGTATAPTLLPTMTGVEGVNPIYSGAGAPTGFTWLTTVTYEYQVCFKCHSSFTTLPTYLPAGWTGTALSADGLKKLTTNTNGQIQDSRDMAREFNPSNQSFHPVMAAGTNLNINAATFQTGYTFTSRMYCSSCHNNPNKATAGQSRGPHGSVNLHLLDGVTTAAANYATVHNSSVSSVSEVCIKCHKSGSYNTGNTSSRFGFHQYHMMSPVNSECYTCHDTHGSEQYHLMNFNRNDGCTYTWTSPGTNSQNTFPHVAGTGSTLCNLSCHGTGHGTGKPYTPAY